MLAGCAPPILTPHRTKVRRRESDGSDRTADDAYHRTYDIREGIMTEKPTGLLRTGIVVVLALAATACGYDRGSSVTGPGYGDTAAISASGADAISAAEGRSRFRVFTANGDISPVLAEFRAALGDPPNGGNPGRCRAAGVKSNGTGRQRRCRAISSTRR